MIATGGARIGKKNATWPFAKLIVDGDSLTINASFIGEVTFIATDITSIEAFSSKSGPLLGGNGVKFNHTVNNYNENIVFWTKQDADQIIKNIKSTGFLNNTSPINDSLVKEIQIRQKQGESQFKDIFKRLYYPFSFLIAALVFIPTYLEDGSSFNVYKTTQLLSGLTVFICILLLFVKPISSLILKPGRSLEHSKSGIYIILLSNLLLFFIMKSL